MNKSKTKHVSVVVMHTHGSFYLRKNLSFFFDGNNTGRLF